MKKIFSFITLALMSLITFGQNMDSIRLINSIDSLARLRTTLKEKIEEFYLMDKSLVDKQNGLINQLNKSYPNRTAEPYICVMGTLIYEAPKSYKSIKPLKQGDEISVVEELEDQYKVTLGGNLFGYIAKAAVIKKSTKIASRNMELQKEERENRIKNQLEADRIEAEKVRMASIKKKYGETIGNKIIDGKIWIGMTSEMAIDSWGAPSEKNRTVGSWGVHEQWVYGDHTYLYFENGKLTSWQD